MTDPFAPPAPGDRLGTLAAPLRIPAPPAGWASAPPTRSSNRLATASLVLGIVAMILNVLVVPTVLAIVFGAIALGRGTTARARSIVGIVLGGLGIFAVFVQLAVLIPVVLAILGSGQHVPFHERMASQIERSLNSSGDMVVSDVVCPVAGEFHAGKQLICTAVRDGVGPIEIDATFTDSSGAYTYVTDSTPNR